MLQIGAHLAFGAHSGKKTGNAEGAEGIFFLVNLFGIQFGDKMDGPIAKLIHGIPFEHIAAINIVDSEAFPDEGAHLVYTLQIGENDADSADVGHIINSSSSLRFPIKFIGKTGDTLYPLLDDIFYINKVLV